MASANLPWKKSTRSAQGGCVEVAHTDESVLVRDSKDREGPILAFSVLEWNEFLAGVRRNEFPPR